MTDKQLDIIRGKSQWTRWRFSLHQDIMARTLIFDLYELLPDDNVEAFLRDCPSPGGWSCEPGEKHEKENWFYHEPYERRQWYASCILDCWSTVNAYSPGDVLECQHREMENATMALICYLREATDYTARKTADERAAMYAECEKIRLDGPPE